jgi:hypothetical protein
MTESKPIKCAAKGYNPGPFFLIQEKGDQIRFIASFQNKLSIKEFLQTFIAGIEGEMLVKIRDHGDKPKPIDFSGSVTQQKLIEVLDRFEQTIFHDGMHDLLIRNATTGEYVAFDEHGLVYIYSEENYTPILTEFKLEHKPDERLIYEFDHWHYRAANGKEDLKDLINELQLHHTPGK